MQMEQFLERLASAEPTPGGGSASALAGALSASLLAMTAGLSVRKGRLEGKEVREIRRKALAIQKRLLRAVDEDARSYEGVLRAFRLSKNTEREKLARSRAIQTAYQKATVPPQKVCRHCLELLEYSRILLSKGNPNALSDAGVAAFLADAAITGGLLNIKINIGTLTDKRFLREMFLLMGKVKRKRDRLIKANKVLCKV